MMTDLKEIKGQVIVHPDGSVEVDTSTGPKHFKGEEAKQIREQYLLYSESKPGAGKWNLHIQVGEYDIEVEEPIGEQHKERLNCRGRAISMDKQERLDQAYAALKHYLESENSHSGPELNSLLDEYFAAKDALRE